MTIMNVETFVFDTPSIKGYASGLKMAAKRYTVPALQARNGFTIIACHGLGQHKEQWEPILEGLFNMQAHRSSRLRVREAWVFDWQNHGESAVLNRNLIKDDVDAAPLTLWGAAIAAFIRTGRVDGHRLVGLGYSAGCVALLLCTKYFTAKQPFSGLILIDPSMMDADTWHANKEELQAMFDFVKKGATLRRDSWPTKAEALKYLKTRLPFNEWDDRILRVYAEHGLYETINRDGKRHVQRKCPAVAEASFRANLEITWQAMAQADKIQHYMPVHMVLGTGEGVIPAVVRDCVIDKKKGRRYASVSIIPDVGHMIVQMSPDAVVDTVSALLEQIASTEVVARL